MSYQHFFNHHLPQILRQIRKIKKNERLGYYAVAVGRRIGIYQNWPSCKVQVDNISNAKYQRFNTYQEAMKYLQDNNADIPIPMQDYDIDDFEQFDSEHGSVYIDGSCLRNGLPDACAGVGIYWPGNHNLNQGTIIDGRQTSIRAEIWAAILAIRQAKQLGFKSLTIYTDSYFVIQAATKWIYKWKRNCWMTSSGAEVKNRYDIMILEEAIKSIDNKIVWRTVSAHSGIHGNEEADRLAKEAILKHLAEQNCAEDKITDNNNNNNNNNDNMIPSIES